MKLKSNRLAQYSEKHGWYVTESVRFILRLYGHRYRLKAIAMLKQMEKVLPEYKERNGYTGDSIIKIDRLRGFLGAQQSIPSDDEDLEIMIEFIRRDKRMEGYEKLLDRNSMLMTLGDTTIKYQNNQGFNDEAYTSAIKLAENCNTTSYLSLLPDHSVLTIHLRQLPGTPYIQVLVLTFDPLDITSDLNLKDEKDLHSYGVYWGNLNINLKVAKRIENTLSSLKLPPLKTKLYGCFFPALSYHLFHEDNTKGGKSSRNKSIPITGHLIDHNKRLAYSTMTFETATNSHPVARFSFSSVPDHCDQEIMEELYSGLSRIERLITKMPSDDTQKYTSNAVIDIRCSGYDSPTFNHFFDKLCFDMGR